MPTDAEIEEYRSTARAWLSENTDPAEDAGPFPVLHWMGTREAERAHYDRTGAMQQKLHAAGYAAWTYPVEYGGHGGEAWQQNVFAEEAANRSVNTGFQSSISAMAAPAFMAHGTEEQKLTHLPGLLSGSVGWCQLFSEPGAGSDLAGLGCRAERDGDEFVITGQKVWNSTAMWAEMGILLVRTDPDARKHKGITFLLFPMDQPGVEVRPLIQANGVGHFAEVFIDGARCPVENVLGEIDGGWGPARTVMANESTLIGTSKFDTAASFRTLADMVGAASDPVLRQRLVDIYARQLILGWIGQRMKAEFMAGRATNLHPSLLKLYVAESRRREGDLAPAMLGPAGVAEGHDVSRWAMEKTMNRYMVSIGGGTDEVHHNNIGEQALGLPRDIRVDREIAWKDVPKG
jgi:alkylation response protein AidB-like acyl-CoA dehydrogenase